jgi:serine/threonine protein phosphatase PrpC
MTGSFPPDAGPLEIAGGSASDVGKRRAVNEDSYLCADPIYLVADGMGGHDAGDRASAAVVGAFLPLAGRGDLEATDVVEAIARANAAVRAISQGLERGAGSTMAGIAIVNHEGLHRWLVFNIGDSRVYRLRDGELTQVTVDHSVAQELVDQGRLERAEMSRYGGRNVITRAVGAADSPSDYWLLPVVNGERFMVCSDGLTVELDDEVIRAMLTMGGPARRSAGSLARAAVEAGGRDNVTVVVVDVLSGGTYSDLEDAMGRPAGADGLGAGIDATTATRPSRRIRGV